MDYIKLAELAEELQNVIDGIVKFFDTIPMEERTKDRINGASKIMQGLKLIDIGMKEFESIG